MKRCSTRKYDQQRFPEISEAIKSGKYTVKKPDSSRYKQQETWAKWRMIFDEADQLLKHFYFCDSCSAIYNVNITNSGKCLKNHAMECKTTENGEDRIQNHFSPIFQPNKKKKISIDHRNSVMQSSMNYIVNDMRPISSLNGDGLNSLLSKMTFIGAKYGGMNEKELAASGLIPSRQKVNYSVDLIVIAIHFLTKEIYSNHYLNNFYR